MLVDYSLLVLKSQRLETLKDSVPYGSRELIRLVPTVGNFALFFSFIWFVLALYAFYSLPGYTPEQMFSRLLATAVLLFLIPLTLAASAVLSALYELIADVSIDIRRLRLVQQETQKTEWND